MNDITIIITVILSVSTGILIGCIMTASISREAYRLIEEIKEWAVRPTPERDREGVGYNDARMDIRLKIKAFETEE